MYTAIRDSYSFETSDWTQEIKNILAENIARLPEGVAQPERNERASTGLLTHYSDTVSDLLRHDENSFLSKELLARGLTPGDEYVSLHMAPFVAQKAKDEGIENLFSKNSLSKVAEDIIDTEPATRAVIGESWLLDTPVGQRVGFHISERMPLNGSLGTWYQFIDKDGNLKDEEIRHFLETGKPRFYERQGYMLIEEFLKKYLPDTRHGTIMLKKIDSEFLNLVEEEKSKVATIVTSWDTVSVASLKDMVSNTKILSRFFAETDIGKKTWDFFLHEKEKGTAYEKMISAPEVTEYSEAYKSFVDSLTYIQYAVEV